MIFPLLLALQAPVVPPAPAPAPQNPYSVVAEPVALALAGWDMDGDARVSAAEANAGVARSFAAQARAEATLGFLAFADWAERWLGNRSALPSPFEVDRDGDNRVSLPELQARITAIFTRLDVDKDGYLTRAELLTVRDPARPQRPDRTPPPDPRPPR